MKKTQRNLQQGVASKKCKRYRIEIKVACRMGHAVAKGFWIRHKRLSKIRRSNEGCDIVKPGRIRIGGKKRKKRRK